MLDYKPSAAEIVQQLDFSPKTAKRVASEAWSFTVVAPFQVLVTNESYGNLKDEHSYTVTIRERGDYLVPHACECPADTHGEQACKHRVSLAVIGGPVVLEAARDFPAEQSNTASAKKLATDGGIDLAGGAGKYSRRQGSLSEPEENDECEECAELGGFPCAACYISGAKDFPEAA